MVTPLLAKGLSGVCLLIAMGVWWWFAPGARGGDEPASDTATSSTTRRGTIPLDAFAGSWSRSFQGRPDATE
ncbi:MAG TPA: hypothetical protein PKB10_15190, partial [Tepidisphaeraceae bacterium]|nr:hypothetical protein [Tepidisphaeraceae bacterium]